MSRKNKRDENKEGNASTLAYLNQVVAGISSRDFPSIPDDVRSELGSKSISTVVENVGNVKEEIVPGALDEWFDNIRKREMPRSATVHLNEDVINVIKKVKIATKLSVGSLINQIVIDWLEKNKDDLSRRLRANNKFGDI